MKDWRSQARLKRDCKYHVVIPPKYRRKVLYGPRRKQIGAILRRLCRRKGIELVEGKAMPDHVHILLSVLPKHSIAMIRAILIPQFPMPAGEWFVRRYNERE